MLSCVPAQLVRTGIFTCNGKRLQSGRLYPLIAEGSGVAEVLRPAGKAVRVVVAVMQVRAAAFEMRRCLHFGVGVQESRTGDAKLAEKNDQPDQELAH